MQKYIILALAIIVGVLAFMLWCRAPEVISETKTVEKRVIQREFIKTNATVTGVTTVTISKDGTTTASGNNITIIASAETEVITDTIIEEREVVKYDVKDIILSLDYLHENSHPDVLHLNISKRILGDIYLSVGYSILVQPNILANPSYELHIESWSVGIALCF